MNHIIDVIDDVEAADEARQREEEQLQRVLQDSIQDYNSRVRAQNDSARSSNVTERDLESLNQEIEEVQAQIGGLEALLRELCKEREEKLRQKRDAQAMLRRGDTDGRSQAGKINYNDTDFDWTGALRDKLQSVFGFESFRLCQEGICNASMDGRDIVAIMPTGGGKSLGYQLPALMVQGCTLVISPLLALIADQIMHLHEAAVDAVMLTGATSREESDRTYKRLQAMASDSRAPDIKLCYVTPEKIANSKMFKSALDKLYRVNKLARFVVDEAHCVSSQGHDFRPDYQKLSTLRQMFPKVPILALSATCPAAVLSDLLGTLRMPPLTMASAAAPQGTVLFSTSLYRKNLHYHVLPKPSGTNDSLNAMMNYILEKHPHDTGIVYCLTRKDAESVAESLGMLSNGRIKTGVYHADVPDAQKQSLHRQWREGKVKVVCATIAFGLGIDKGDVRFVIHHSLSKSLDGFYQESGRAGRDGKDADCVLYYRPQDATRIASLTYGERGGPEKALDMLAFASNIQECRKILFASYFNKSSKLSFSSWATAEEDTLTRCGHCDNCTRPPEALESLGTQASVAAWQILRVAEAAGKELTMAQLCDLARSLGGGGASKDAGGAGRGKGKGRGREKVSVDVNEAAGGKVELSRERTEALCVRLVVDRYLALTFSPTAYAVNVYLKPAALANRFTRHTRAAIEQGKGPAFDCAFLRKEKATKSRKAAGGTSSASAASKGKKRKQKERATEAEAEAEDSVAATPHTSSSASAKARGKRKRVASVESWDDMDADMDGSQDDAAWRKEMAGFITDDDAVSDAESISDSEMEWQPGLSARARVTKAKKDSNKGRDPPLKRARQSLASTSRTGPSSSSKAEFDKEVIEISDSD